ncbi:hypothetical protein [Salinifilum ghardaiensis]
MNQDEDDEVREPLVQAAVTVVPAWSGESGELRSRGGRPVDPAAAELDDELAEHLAESAITLSAPVDLSPGAVAALRESLPRPPAFDRSGLLRGHHLLELDAHGRAVVDDVTVHHDATFGLLVQERST